MSPRNPRSNDVILAVTFMTWPEPKPCKPKWCRVPFEQMLRQIREDKCEQCRALVLYLERESEIDTYLRRSRN
jgi:hypothetical protein